MKRKQFFATVAAASLGSLGGYGFGKLRAADKPATGGAAEIGPVGGLGLEELRETYRADLFDNFLPNMDRSVIDHDYGGFMCSVDIRTGETMSTDKRAWYEGRGMWTYGFLYNNLKQDPSYLEVIRNSKDFILKHQPQDGEFWAGSFSREGEALSGPGDIYCNLFIAEGLAQYAIASGERDYLERAKKITLDSLARYDSPDYDYHISYLAGDASPEIPGARVLGHWMVFLIGATQILEHDSDPEIERLADRCVEAIMEHHLNPAYGLLNEGLNHDFTIPDNEFSQFAYMGHGIETLWMVMYEAVRRQDRDLFRESSDAFKRHVTVAQDAVYGGYFRSLDHVDDYTWKVDKVLWLQEEVLIGSMILIEHMNDPWARERFAETYSYVRKTFKRPGYKFWTSGGDRTLTEHNTGRAEHYHHPRHLMLNLTAVERMIERGGSVSGLFG
ncbi:MAG: AGE family epimerase/isomerase [Balneolaceae bacterium]